MVTSLTSLFSRFSANLALRLSRKISEDDLVESVNPFNQKLDDEGLIYSRLFFKNTYFFNRLSRVYSLELTTINNLNKVSLNNGFDSRFNKAIKVRGRVNLNAKISFVPEFEEGNKGLNSEFFSSRDFDYSYLKWSPSIQWVFSRSFRVSLFYRNYSATNAKDLGGESTTSDEIGLQTVYNALGKGSIDFNLKWNSVNYSGQEGTPLSFDMLNGLANGSNLVWNLGVGKRFSNHLQLQLQYNGRKNGSNTAIHIGNVSARYLF